MTPKPVQTGKAPLLRGFSVARQIPPESMDSSKLCGNGRIAVCLDSGQETDSSPTALARALRLPLIDSPEETFQYLLRYRSGRLELHKFGVGQHGPVVVDFLSGRLGYRLLRDPNKHQPLGRALGLKRHPHPDVIDATAGLGRDALVMASLGCCVLMLERSPIIAALLEDGLTRARNDEALGLLIRERIELQRVEAINHFRSLRERKRPTVIYLDPMYPLRRKNTKVKKEMRVLRDIVGEDADAGRLVRTALECATRRVVVKRPKRANPLPGPSPSSVIHGKTTRYDIYTIT